jgi:Flp pilus assembly pilin Flp
MFEQLRAFARNDSGDATFEYAIVVAIFGVTVIGGIQAVLNTSGGQLTSTQSNLSSTSLSLPTPAAT